MALAPSTVVLATRRRRRCTVTLAGVVQGIGFRPAVHRLATRHGLAGSVCNSMQGVVIDVEGEQAQLDRFMAELDAVAPAGARRAAIAWSEPRDAVHTFDIAPSLQAGAPHLSPAPDLPTCEACLAELFDTRDRRHRYALTTCSACGPRFTITRALPYDRERTTMASFIPCEPCRREYETPADRRFHAETIACPRCGPRLVAADGDRPIPTDAVEAAVRALCAGAIVAVKGVGGYHLACDATNAAAVVDLRRRKQREAKPLAVMVKSVAAAVTLCWVSDAEARLLASPARPIVLLTRRPSTAIADAVAPGCRELGLMLPYTPLHHLLLDAVDTPLVMTSGNASDDTIAYLDDDARERLGGVADLLVTHDRPIVAPCDDSVARVVRDIPRVIRRARGYVPLPVDLPVAAARPILACGGDLKNTFALARGHDAFLSQHLGDLASERAFRCFRSSLAYLSRVLDLEPRVVAHDLHPAYRSTAFAHSLDGVERIGVQHHHAHIASCLADNGVDRRVIGVAWDGTGYGTDGGIWGGEFLIADLAGFERAAHLEPVPLPGGDAAVREPWRMAAVFLRAAYGDDMSALDLSFVRRLDHAAWRTLTRAIDQGLNAPLTTSAGRLFDAIASLLGVRDRIAYEAHAAIELEAIATVDADLTYPTAVSVAGDAMVVRTTDIVRGVVNDLLREMPAATIAARFHATLAHVIVDVCERLRARTGLHAVALSGGVFQNVRLLESVLCALERRGFEVYTHRHVPTNDGGLALGQAAVAARRLRDTEPD
jgi:hydrogenase maturation protein HypF